MTITVVVVDDQALVRGGFRVLVDSAADLEVVGEADTGDRAIAVVTATRPDVVLMDIRMPGLDGISATRAIVATPGNVSRILILTTFDLDEYVYDALQAGASGFLLKDAPPETLLEGIRVLAEGNWFRAERHEDAHRRIRETLAHASNRHDNARTRHGSQKEVLLLVARGLSNAEIAEELAMSLATAKTHVSRLLQKLGVRDRAQLVVFSYESGLMTSG